MPLRPLRRHFRQLALFLAVGLAQLSLDSAIFVLATAAGVPVVPGNVLGRASGAGLGFLLNGRFTFAEPGKPRLSGSHLRRFVVAWLLMTGASSALLHMLSTWQSLQAAWLAKPMVEAVMAVIGFLVWRQFVFR